MITIHAVLKHLPKSLSKLPTCKSYSQKALFTLGLILQTSKGTVFIFIHFLGSWFIHYLTPDFTPREGRGSSGRRRTPHTSNLSILSGTFWTIHRSWDLSIRRWTGSTFADLRNSLLRTWSWSFIPWTFRKNPLSAACTSNSTLSVNTYKSWTYFTWRLE